MERDVPSERTNALGFCVGGTILSCAAAVLAARRPARDSRALNHAHAGFFRHWRNRPAYRCRISRLARGDDRKGRYSTPQGTGVHVRHAARQRPKLALRPRQLSQGCRAGRAFDLLHWDSDSVSLPSPIYCWYARNTYLENNIKDPGKTTQCGVRVDFC
jgi:polyhydroxyalkanoate synthase